MARRVIFFVVGIMAYGLFLATVLCCICFVGNLALLKGIDEGAAVPWSQALVVDLALIALFGVQHSVMARPAFKRSWQRVIPTPLERSVYVLLSSGCLLLLFWWWQPLPTPVWDTSGTRVGGALTALYWVGWGMVMASTHLIDHFDLFGLRQVTLFLRGVEYTPPAFKQPLVYRFVRHPLMLSTLIAFWATPRMSVGHLVLAVGMTLYTLIGIAFEEGDLLAAHGVARWGYAGARTQVKPETNVAPWTESHAREPNKR
jgi:protein-S-isoprenylcysteine O-methyltransferase Ste14